MTPQDLAEDIRRGMDYDVFLVRNAAAIRLHIGREKVLDKMERCTREQIARWLDSLTPQTYVSPKVKA